MNYSMISNNLTGWPEQVRTMQRNWIGRSEGLEIHFAVDKRSNNTSIHFHHAS